MAAPALKPLVPVSGKLCFLFAIVFRCLCHKAREVASGLFVRSNAVDGKRSGFHRHKSELGQRARYGGVLIAPQCRPLFDLGTSQIDPFEVAEPESAVGSVPF